MFDPGKVTFLSQNLPNDVQSQIQVLDSQDGHQHNVHWVCLDLNGNPYKANIKSYKAEELKNAPSLKSSLKTFQKLASGKDNLVWVDYGDGHFIVGKTSGEKIKGQSICLETGKKLKVGLIKLFDCKVYQYSEFPGLSGHLPGGRNIYQSSDETTELIKAIYYNKPIQRIWELISPPNVESLCIHFLTSPTLLKKWFRTHPGEYNENDLDFDEIKVKPDSASAFIDLFGINSEGNTCFVHLGLEENRDIERDFFNFLRIDLDDIGILFTRKFTNISKMPPNCIHIDLRELITFIKAQEPEQIGHLTGIPSRFVA